MIKLSIVTLNYKKPQLTLACLDSVYKQYKKDLEDNFCEVIVVDNASSDDSVQVIQKAIIKHKYKNVRLIANKTNDGFGAGNNTGAAKAKGEYICFLNNDTIVQDRGFLDMALFLDSHPTVGILGGQLRNFNGSLQPSSGKFYTLVNILLLMLGMQRYGLLDKSPKQIELVDWVKGGLLMIRKEVFDKLNGFDENIFMYTEDMELCFRAKIQGFPTYFYPFVNVLHKEHGSSNRTFAIVNIYKNLLYFYKKHKSSWEYLFVKDLLTVKAKMLVWFGKICHNNYLIQTYEQALSVLR